MTNPEFRSVDKIRIEEWAAGMRAEAGVLERSAETLEEVVTENERGGYESYAEDMAARAYRRLAAYLRRDAAAALEFASTEVDQDNAAREARAAAEAAAQAAHDDAQAAYDMAAHLHHEALDTVATIVRRRGVDARDVAAANNTLRASYADLQAARAACAAARDDLYNACTAVRVAEREDRADAIDAARRNSGVQRRPNPGTLEETDAAAYILREARDKRDEAERVLDAVARYAAVTTIEDAVYASAALRVAGDALDTAIAAVDAARDEYDRIRGVKDGDIEF